MGWVEPLGELRQVAGARLGLSCKIPLIPSGQETTTLPPERVMVSGPGIRVVKVRSLPKVTPNVLLATARKW